MSRWSDARRTDAHRPYPAPTTPWAGHMVWRDLLFMHWRADPEALAARLPANVKLDTLEGEAWVTATAHRMGRMGPRLLPGLPAFPELNVRTYASADGKPGVVFLSLHAPNPLVVAGGRMLGLRYRMARTVLRKRGPEHRFASRAGAEHLSARYVPQTGKVDEIDHLLAERYCLYTHSGLRIEVQHPPWPLQPVQAQISHNLEAYGIVGPPDRTSFSRGVDVVTWPPQRVAETGHHDTITEESLSINH